MNFQQKFLICLIFVMASFCGKSQSNFSQGYIVTSQNDTIKGFVDYKTGSNTVFFKTNLQSGAKEYHPESIQSFRIKNHKPYISRVYQTGEGTSSKFMQLIVSGKADLYAFLDGKTDHYILDKKDGKSYDFTKTSEKVYSEGRIIAYDSKKYRAILTLAFADDQNLYPLIDLASYSESSLVEITKGYNRNQVKEMKTITYKDPKFKIAPYISGNVSNLTFNNATSFERVSSKNYISAGLILNAALPCFRNALSLQISGEYSQLSFYGNGLSKLSPTPQEIDIDATAVKGKAGLKYTFSKGRFRPAVLISGNMVTLSNIKGSIVDLSNSSTTNYFNNNMVTSKPLIGYSLDFEITYNSRSLLKPFLNIGFDNAQGHQTATVSGSTVTFKNILSTTHFATGIYF